MSTQLDNTLVASRSWVTNRLSAANPLALTLYGVIASFSAYFCMYAFRKPFAAGTYEALSFLDTKIELKTAFVLSQLVGYILSKFLGIKICSETTRGRRAIVLIGMIVIAEVALLFFAILPNDWKVVAIFFNGLPLGMVWGLVVLYLEGRRTSDALLAGLSCSFILASGVVKDIGRSVMSNYHVSEFWMPLVTGALFLTPFVVSVWLLEQLPDPTPEDEAERIQRKPMVRADRLSFVRHFFPGLLMLLVAYFFLTAYRDFRDNFGVEIFDGLGYTEAPGIFTKSEMWVTAGVLAALAGLVFIRNNRLGLIAAFAIMTGGTMLLGIGTLLLDAGRISGLTWMIATGLGLYLAYVPYGAVLFDRLIASTGVVATAVFAIYLADFFGYLGAIPVMLLKDYAFGDASRLDFFRGFTYFMSFLATILLAGSCIYFAWWHHQDNRSVQLDDAGTDGGGTSQ